MAIPTTFSTTLSTGTVNLPWHPHEPTTFNKGAIVLAYGSDGLASKWTPEFENHANELAAAGCLVVIPEFLKSPPALRDDDSAVVFDFIASRWEEWAAVLKAAVDSVKALPEIDEDRVGLVGFSLGGFLSLRIRDHVKVLVEYFAPVLLGIGASTNSDLIAHIHHGVDDELIDMDLNATPIEKALKAERVTVTRTNHPGAGHGFLGDGANETARTKSRAETVEFIKKHL